VASHNDGGTGGFDPAANDSQKFQFAGGALYYVPNKMMRVLSHGTFAIAHSRVTPRIHTL
jgi:hypothetical protein